MPLGMDARLDPSHLGTKIVIIWLFFIMFTILGSSLAIPTTIICTLGTPCNCSLPTYGVKCHQDIEAVAFHQILLVCYYCESVLALFQPKIQPKQAHSSNKLGIFDEKLQLQYLGGTSPHMWGDCSWITYLNYS